MLAEDVVFEYIITVPGYPRRVQGRQAVADLYRPYGRSIVLERCYDLALHRDTTTGVIVLEYASEGHVVATGALYANRYISVLTITDRVITRWRDYLDPIAVFDARDGLTAFRPMRTASRRRRSQLAPESLAAQTLAFSKGLLLAEREGIEPHLAAKIMAESQIGSPMLKLRVPLILDPPDEAWFDIGLMHKDIRLVRQAGAGLGTPLPSAAVADEMLTKAEDLGFTHRDIASVHELLARLSTDVGAVRS